MVKQLKIFYQNVRGIRTKTNVIYLALLNTDFDVIVFSETWLNDSISCSEIIDNRYTVFRRDRESAESCKSDGGGVLIAVSKRYKSCRIDSWETRCEDLWVNIVMDLSTVSICAVYIPSPLKYEVLENYINNVERIVDKQSYTILIGDFNIPAIHWTSKDSDPNIFIPDKYSTAGSLLQDFMAMTNLSQRNGICNSYREILDLVFSNCNNVKTEHSTFFACPTDKYHPPLVIKYESSSKSVLLQSPTIVRHNFLRANYSLINACSNKLGTIISKLCQCK